MVIHFADWHLFESILLNLSIFGFLICFSLKISLQELRLDGDNRTRKPFD